MSLMLNKRLRYELKHIQQNPDEHIRLELAPGDDLRRWKGSLKGPSDTPYEGYEFDFDINIGKDYPLAPPSIRMNTKIFHPNIHFKTGEICLDILKKEWVPAWNLLSACRAILLLLSDPAADSPLNCDAGNMVRGGDMMAYNSMAKMYSIEFARKVES